MTHHLGLRAKGSLLCRSDILEKSAHESTTDTSDTDTAHKLFQDGIFLQSEEGDIYKSGIIQVNGKPIVMAAKKELIHKNLTQAGENQRAVLALARERVVLEKESILRGCAAELNAHESILQQGKINPGNYASEHKAPTDTLDPTGLLALNANEITTTESSQIDANNIYMAANEKINQNGIINAQENLFQAAPLVALGNSSSITATNASIDGTEKLSQEGKIVTRQALLMRANYLYNFGDIRAENAHFKADRWWINKGTVHADNEVNVDALLSVKMPLGKIQAKNLRTNAICDINLLDFQKLKAPLLTHCFVGVLAYTCHK